MGAHLNTALKTLLEKHADKLKFISMVYFDPFGECGNTSKDYGDVSYRVRPALMNGYKSQLLAPGSYAEKGDNFAGTKLYKIVAWDHVSYPGNDFFGNSRSTDDGVSAAATNSMEVITGLRGNYADGQYNPPTGYSSWEDVVDRNDIKLVARGNVKVVTRDARIPGARRLRTINCRAADRTARIDQVRRLPTMTTSSTAASAYQTTSAQTYVQQQQSATQRPAQQQDPASTSASNTTGAQPLNASGRGQLVNVTA